MMTDRQQLARERAYAIWEAEGRQTGREQEHWDRALREIDEQGARPPEAVAAGTGAASEPSRADAADHVAEDSVATTAARPKRTAKGTAAKATAKPSPGRTTKSKSSKSPA